MSTQPDSPPSSDSVRVPPSLSGRLATGAGWVLASRIVISVFGLANTVVLARLLMPEDFGLVAIATTISGIVFAMTELSMSQALVQHKNPQQAHYDTAFTFNMMRSGAVALLLAAASWPVAAIYDDPRLMPLIVAIGAGNVLTGGFNPKLVVMMRELVFWQDFAIRLGEKFFTFATATACALIWESYWALIAGMFAGQAVALMISYVIVPYRPRLQVSEWRDLMSFSAWLTLSRLVNTVNWQADQLLVGYLLGNRELGFYTVGSRIAAIPAREVTQPVAQVTFPGFARLVDDPVRLRSAYTRAQTLLTAVAMAAGMGFVATADPLVRLVMGERWLPIVPIIQVLAGVFAIQTLASPVDPLCMAMARTRTLFNRSLLTLAIRLPLVVIGLVAGGLPGVLAARVLMTAIGLGINTHLVCQLIEIPVMQQFWANRRSVFASLVMAAATWSVGAVIGDVTGVALVGKLLAMIACLAVSFPTVLFALWHLERRPDGPEHDIRKGAAKILSRLRRPRKA